MPPLLTGPVCGWLNTDSQCAQPSPAGYLSVLLVSLCNDKTERVIRLHKYSLLIGLGFMRHVHLPLHTRLFIFRPLSNPQFSFLTLQQQFYNN